MPLPRQRSVALGGGGGGATTVGLLSARPAAGNEGDLYAATDNGLYYFDNGSSWVVIADYQPTALVDADIGVTVQGYAQYADLMNRTLAGMVVPVNALDRWKAGPGLQATMLGTTLNSSTTTVVPDDSSITPDAVHRILQIENEQIYTTAGETTASLTVSTRGSVNGTAAAAHTAPVAIKASRLRNVIHIGDSIAEGVTTSTTVASDGWSVRAARVLAKRLGGLVGEMWPLWRETSISQVHQEYVLTGSAISGVTAWDVGFVGSVLFTAGSANGFVWTRPADVDVRAFEIHWVDYGTVYCDWSYSIDGGSTWVQNPVSASASPAGNGTNWSSGQGKLRKILIACDNPTTIRVRAANSSGTSKTTILPYVPLTTYSTRPTFGTTEGVMWANLGHAGVKLRTQLNSRTVVTAGNALANDGTITNGDATLTSTLAVFVTNDVGSTIYINGVSYTILSRTSATEVELTTNYAGSTTTTARLTIFQGDGTTDRLGSFLGHHGSTFPDLVIIGPYSNDMTLPTLANGDSCPEAMTDMLTYIWTRISPVADVLFICPPEVAAGAEAALQQSYRTAIKALAATLGAASLDLYDAFDAYGYTGYTAVNAGGFMADGTHLSPLGQRWMGSHLARVLEFI